MSDLSAAAPSLSDIRVIANLADPVVRNLRITQCYHELAVAMAALTGSGANWCAMATWASKQAGQSIRKEDLVRALEDLVISSDAVGQAARDLEAGGAQLPGGGARSLGGAVVALWQAVNPAAIFERTGEAVALGNLKVFEEIGYEFARFLTLFGDGRPDEERLAAFCEGLRAGEPPEGQEWLRRAFTHYHQALAVPDPKARAELMLLANLEIGYHEQTRLQPEIVAALNAPIYDPAELRRRLLAELFPNPVSRVRVLLLRLLGRSAALIAARDRLAQELQRLGRLVITEHLMTLRLFDGRVVRLGQDLRVEFPALLQHMVHPALQALLSKVDLSPDSLDGTGAHDWGRLPDRMHFIADLFRVYHLDAGLFAPPFTADQVAVIKAGKRPAGRL